MGSSQCTFMKQSISISQNVYWNSKCLLFSFGLHMSLKRGPEIMDFFIIIFFFCKKVLHELYINPSFSGDGLIPAS